MNRAWKWAETILLYAIILGGCALLIYFAVVLLAEAQTVPLRYAANRNLVAGRYAPGAYGFTLADVSSKSGLDSLPAGVAGLIWVGTCTGADASFRSFISGFRGDSRVFGFYLMDEPDPSVCSGRHLAAETAFIHSIAPGWRSFVILLNLSATATPSYGRAYLNDVDLVGLDPYPCRQQSGCHLAWIDAAVSIAELDGYPYAAMVPVYQSFGGGRYISDTGDHYAVPTTRQELDIAARWASLLPNPAFTYAYAWGSQEQDTAISNDAALQRAFLSINGS